MIITLKDKTIEILCNIITGDNVNANYRKGYQLSEFFSEFGLSPLCKESRWWYARERLFEINGTEKMEKCIINAFDVQEYIENIETLDKLIELFNQYLVFDKLKIIRENAKIILIKLNEIIVEETKKENDNAKLFNKLINEIDEIVFEKTIKEVLTSRIKEIRVCIENNAPIASIILMGSVLEAILLNTAKKYPKCFYSTKCAPKKDDKVVKLEDWKLFSLIDAATEIGMLKKDANKFSHVLRDFRNYIHPNEQLCQDFIPNLDTAHMCLDVLAFIVKQIKDFVM